MITLWNLTAGVIHPSQLLLNGLNIQDGGALSRFVIGLTGQPSAGTLFTVANGQLLGIKSIDNAINLGYNGSMIQLSQSTINTLGTGVWQGYLATDGSGNVWVLDGGAKRSIANNQAISAWEGSNTPTPLGNVYLSLLPTLSSVGDSIKSSGDATYYGISGGQRFGMPSLQAYTSSGLDPVTQVSSSLVNSVPSGGIWPAH